VASYVARRDVCLFADVRKAHLNYEPKKASRNRPTEKASVSYSPWTTPAPWEHRGRSSRGKTRSSSTLRWPPLSACRT